MNSIIKSLDIDRPTWLFTALGKNYLEQKREREKCGENYNTQTN